MNVVRYCAGWGVAIAMLLLSPVVVIFSIPVAIGLGLDLFEMFGETPFVLAAGLPFAWIVLGKTLPTIPGAALIQPRPTVGGARIV